MRYFCKTLCLMGIFLLCCITIVQAQEQLNAGYYKMICRGDDSAFRIDDLEKTAGKVKMGLNFLPSSTAAKGNAKKIDPGTCSWDDRTVSDSEPKQIQFNVTSTQAQKIRDVLNSPDKFWQFYVRVTNYGYFETLNHKQLILLRVKK